MISPISIIAVISGFTVFSFVFKDLPPVFLPRS